MATVAPPSARRIAWRKAFVAGANGALIDGRYRLEAELGHGGMGVVYRARDVGLDREVALKVIEGARVGDVNARRQFVAEARGLARLRNEHVVRVHAFGEHGTSLFFVMELVDGQTLASVLEAHTAAGEPVPLATALRLLDGVADGLDAVHAAGLLHRDMKPENVVVEARTDRTVLVDFGLTVDLRHILPEAPWGGTPDYMAPEVARGETGSSASDVYAFGCTAFELLTGESPFAAPTPRELRAQHEDAIRPRASWIRPELTAADATLRRGLARDPRDRPATAGAMMEELRRTLAPTTASSRPPASLQGDGRTLILLLDGDIEDTRACARAVGIAFFGAHRLVMARSASSVAEALGGCTPRIVLVDVAVRANLDAVRSIRDMPGGTHTCVVGLHRATCATDEVRLAELEILDLLPLPMAFPEILSGLQIIARRRGLCCAPAPLTARLPDVR